MSKKQEKKGYSRWKRRRKERRKESRKACLFIIIANTPNGESWVKEKRRNYEHKDITKHFFTGLYGRGEQNRIE